MTTAFHDTVTAVPFSDVVVTLFTTAVKECERDNKYDLQLEHLFSHEVLLELTLQHNSRSHTSKGCNKDDELSHQLEVTVYTETSFQTSISSS